MAVKTETEIAYPANRVISYRISYRNKTHRRHITIRNRRFAQATIEQFKEQLEDSRETTADIQRQLTKAVGEASALRQKADVAEEGIRPEEVEDLKRKMGIRLQDSESQLEATLSKAVAMEKAKNRLQVELEAVSEDLEKVPA